MTELDGKAIAWHNRPRGIGARSVDRKVATMSSEGPGQNGGAADVFDGWLSGGTDAGAGLVQLAQAASSALGESIGQVDTLQGEATITHVDGTKVAAAKGTPVYQGDTVITGKTGNLGIVFADKSTFALGKDGQMVLDEMVYDPGTSSGKMAVNVAEGVFSFVSGQIAKTGAEAMTIKTPVATIGIRGTAGAGNAGPEGTPNSFSMLPDPQGGQIGEMSIRTSVGIETLNQVFATTAMSSKFNAPSLPTIVPSSFVSRAFGDVAKNAGVTSTFAPSPTTTGTTSAALSGAQQQAAARAFEQSLAQGKSPAEAMAAAAEQGANVQHTEKWDKIGIGPFANEAIAGAVTKDILDAQTGAAQGGQGVDKDPLGAGRGNSNDFGAKAASSEEHQDEGEKSRAETEEDVRATSDEVAEAIASPPPKTLEEEVEAGFEDVIAFNDLTTKGLVGIGLEGEAGGFDFTDLSQEISDTFGSDFASQVMGGALNDTIAPSIFNDDGSLKGESLGAFVDAILQESQIIFDQVMLENFFQDAGFQGPAGNDVPADFQDFIDDLLNGDIPDTFIPEGTTGEFQEFVDATTGNDNLLGGDANTQFLMFYGLSLGGTDSVNGGLGSDELAFLDLYDVQLIFDAAAGTITYADSGTINGTIALTSVEQIFAGASGQNLTGINSGISTGGADVGAIGGVRLALNETSDFGYILVGKSTGDTLTAADGTLLNYNSMNHSIGMGGHTTFGAVIFGLDGDDNITGSDAGNNIIFGGEGNDIISVNLVAGQDNALYGLGNNAAVTTDGTNTFNINGTDTYGFTGAIVGGDGSDIVQTADSVLNLGWSTFGFAGIETLAGASTFIVRNDMLTAAGGSITNFTGSGSATVKSSGTTLNLANVSLTNVTTLENASGAGEFHVDATQVTAIATYTSAASGGTIAFVGGGTADFSLGQTFTNNYIGTIVGEAAQNDTFVFNAAQLTEGYTIDGGAGGTDTLKIADAAALSDTDFANVQGFEKLLLSSTAGNNLTLGSNAEAAFGGTLVEVDGSNVVTHPVTVNGSALPTAALKVTGGSGNDQFIGGSGNDTLTGGSGTDILTGGAGNDSLSGGDLADTLTGGAGNDILTGGNNFDSFVFSGGPASSLGTDRITDFSGTAGSQMDDIVFDTSDLGIAAINFEAVVWDGTSSALNLTNFGTSNVIVLTNAAGTLADAVAALAGGNTTMTDAVFLFHDSANSSLLTMVHSDDLDNGTGTNSVLATFDGTSGTAAAGTLVTGDFAVQA